MHNYVIATDSCHCQQLNRVVIARNMQHMVSNHKNDFSARLQTALDAAGVISGRGRRAAIARALGVSGEAARKWLNGEAIPAMEMASKLAQYADVSVDWLLTGRAQSQANLSIADISRSALEIAHIYDQLPKPLQNYITETMTYCRKIAMLNLSIEQDATDLETQPSHAPKKQQKN